MNLHILIGNVGKDPEIHRTEKTTIAKLNVATDASYTDAGGNRVQVSDWHNVVIFGKLADVVEKYVHKGDKIALQGEVKTRAYEKDGFKKYITETRVNKLELLGKKQEDHKDAPKEDFPEMPPMGADDLPF